MSQAVPARVRAFCPLHMPAPVGFRVLDARLLLPEPGRIGQRRFDRPMDLAVVDVTSFGPKTCSAYEKQRRPRPASDQVAAGWELREAAGEANDCGFRCLDARSSVRRAVAYEDVVRNLRPPCLGVRRFPVGGLSRCVERGDPAAWGAEGPAKPGPRGIRTLELSRPRALPPPTHRGLSSRSTARPSRCGIGILRRKAFAQE
jgi:hypothetical protein